MIYDASIKTKKKDVAEDYYLSFHGKIK